MKTLAQKLYYDEARLRTPLVVGGPPGFLAEVNPPRRRGIPQLDMKFDWLLVFVADQETLRRAAPDILRTIGRDGYLWLAFPRKGGARESDLSRDAGWEPLTAAGLLPVANVALDDDWSALRFRPADRIGKARVPWG